MPTKNGKLLPNLWQTAETKGKTMANIASRLAERGIEIPTIVPPLASYVPFTRTGNLIFISGQLPMIKSKLEMTGLLGRDLTLEQGQSQARQCALNILAVLNFACEGQLGKIHRIIKLTGYVACTPEFTDHPKVINGASDLFLDIFGDAGRHARAAVGVSSLPLNAAVEIEAIAEVS